MASIFTNRKLQLDAYLQQCYSLPIERQNTEGFRMYTFHAIDTVTGTLSHKEHINACELDRFMIAQEAKHWACQVVCDITGKRIVYVIGENGQWSVHSKHKGF